MRLFMLWDMEGVTGLFRRELAWYWGEAAEAAGEGKRLLMADINAATAAALEAGVDELIVCDTHGGGGNIVLEEMLADRRVTYLPRSRGIQDGVLRWMPGLGASVDGFLVLGHHAMAGTAEAFLPHTQTLAWADFRLNGVSVGEMGIEACFAGHWGIPVALAHGDAAACREAEAMFPGVVTVAVKRAMDHDTCAGLDEIAGHQAVAEGIGEAVARLRAGQCQPFKLELPLRGTLRLASEEAAGEAARKPNIERVDEVTVGWTAERQCDVVRWIANAGLDLPEEA